MAGLKGLVKRALGAMPSGGRRNRRNDDGADRRPPGRTAPSTDIATIEGCTVTYAPDVDGEPDCGEVVWTWVPYEEDPTQGKDRPVVLIGRRNGELVGVPLTSKGDRPEEFPVGTGVWDRDGRPSFAKLDRIVEVDARKVRREGGVLPKSRFDDLITALRQFYA